MPNTPTPPETIDPVERFALAYAAPQARPAWEALLVFQHRLEDAARPGREPLMVQLRLAWWRDRLAEPSAQWPVGEPLLARLAMWEGEANALIGLINGWEAKVVGEDGGAALIAAQVAAFEALGRLVGENDPKAVRETAQQLLEPLAAHQTLPKLTSRMRPLSVLRGHAVRLASSGRPRPFANFAALMRIGLFGR